MNRTRPHSTARQFAMALTCTVLLNIALAGCSQQFFRENVVRAKHELQLAGKHLSNMWNQLTTTEVRRVSNDEWTESPKGTDQEEAKGATVRIRSFTVSPDRVRPGQAVTIKVRYVVGGAREEGMTLTDNKELLFEGKSNITLASKIITCTNGTWENTTSFTVPRSAEQGPYKVKESIIQDDGVELQSIGHFDVVP